MHLSLYITLHKILAWMSERNTGIVLSTWSSEFNTYILPFLGKTRLSTVRRWSSYRRRWPTSTSRASTTWTMVGGTVPHRVCPDPANTSLLHPQSATWALPTRSRPGRCPRRHEPTPTGHSRRPTGRSKASGLSPPLCRASSRTPRPGTKSMAGTRGQVTSVLFADSFLFDFWSWITHWLPKSK